jgi:hypothetical protein
MSGNAPSCGLFNGRYWLRRERRLPSVLKEAGVVAFPCVEPTPAIFLDQGFLLNKKTHTFYWNG